jgi:hypothetical protein
MYTKKQDCLLEKITTKKNFDFQFIDFVNSRWKVYYYIILFTSTLFYFEIFYDNYYKP